MQPDRAPTSATKLSRGLFGAGKARPVRAADPERPETDETEDRQAPSGLQHLFGR